MIAPKRRHAVFDADGIHTRALLRTRHLPWPDSRAAFLVDPAYTSQNGSIEMFVRVPAGKGSSERMVTLAGLGSSSAGVDDGSGWVGDEIDRIWAWALRRGYAREVVSAWTRFPDRAGDDAAPGTGDGLVPAVPVDRALVSR